MEQGGTPDVERFSATSGRVSGWLTVGVATVVCVLGIAYLDEGFPPWVVAASALAGVLGWAAMLRPALWVRGREELVLRNMLETVVIRLAAVEELAVRQVLVLRVADRRWVSTVVGRTWRKALLSNRRSSRSTAGGGGSRPDQVVHADFVEERLRQLVDDARAAAGVRPGSPEQLALPDAVRREPAWLPIGLIALCSLALVATLFL